MRRQFGRLAGVVAQQRHHLHRLARPIDAAIEPDEGIERPRIGHARHTAIGQVERGVVEIEHGEIVVRAEGVNRPRRHRPLAVQQWRGEAGDTVRIGGGLGQDVVVRRDQPQPDAGARHHVGEAAHLHGQPVGAAPNGRRQIGAQDHLHRAGRVGCAVAGRRNQRVETGAGRGQRVGQRQRRARGMVRLPCRDWRAALPNDPPGVRADVVRVVGLDRLTEPVFLHEGNDVALGQARQGQLHRRQVDGAHADRRRLVPRQHEHAGVEVDTWAAVGDGDVHRRLLDQCEPVLAGQSGQQHDTRRRTGRQAGDADLITLQRHRGPGHRRRQPHPVRGVKIVAPRWRRGELNAGARWVGLRLGADTADQQSDGEAGVGQALAQLRVVGRTLGRRLQRDDLLRRAVQRLQRVGHQQQRWDLVRPGIDGTEILPCRLQGAVGLGRRAVHLGLGERHPDFCVGLAQRDAGFQRGRGGGPVALTNRGVGLRLGLAAGLGGAASGEALGEKRHVGIAVGRQTGQREIVGVCHAVGQGQQHGRQQHESAHRPASSRFAGQTTPGCVL